MPGWFGIKFSKSKEPPRQDSSPRTPSVKNERKSSKPRSFDETRNSPRKNREGGGGASGFSGFDSSSSMDRHPHPHPHPHPLPRPSTDQIHVASVSGSSLSSSTSSDGHPNHDHAQLAPLRSDARLSPLPSPGPGSRCGTTASSPRHPQLAGLDLDTRLEDSKGGEYHRLPLPPSPTSPGMPTPRTSGVSECSTSNLSKWKKGRLLGRGTFGHVYVGFNSENGQMCAIKEVRVFTDDQSSKESLKQLNQEIMLLSQLSHPNIVEYIGSELGEQTLSVYLEYVSGGSIHKLLQEYGPFREPVIQNYARQILSGLAYLHARNTVHRDIKGANILVGPNGEVKLADFGMAKHITSAASMLSFKGSPYWMAPEVVMNTNGYNLAVDIWSLGCTILEMVTSKPPWSQYEGVAAIFKIGNSKDIPEIPDHLSSDAKGFIRLCLQREPSARPTASQLLDHPFVRDQVSARGGSLNIIRQTFPSASDGSRTPPALELRSRRSLSPEGEYTSRQVLSVSRGLTSPRENARVITSLPVSPSSSPLRNGTSSRSYFLSPQHPSLGFAGQSMYTSNDYSFYPSRVTTRNMLEPWNDAPQLRAPTSGRSPSIRPI